MNKKIPTLIITLGLLYFAYMGRSLLTQLVWDFTSIYSKSEDIPFPLGEGRKVTLNPPFNLIEKPYAVAIKTDLLAARPDAMLYELEKVNYPIHLKFKVYRRKLFSSYQELVFEKEIKNFDDFVNLSFSKNPNSSNPLLIRYISLSTWHSTSWISFEVEDLTPFDPAHKEVKSSISFFISNRKY